MFQEAEICALWDLTKGIVVQLLEAQKKQGVIFDVHGTVQRNTFL